MRVPPYFPDHADTGSFENSGLGTVRLKTSRQRASCCQFGQMSPHFKSWRSSLDTSYRNVITIAVDRTTRRPCRAGSTIRQVASHTLSFSSISTIVRLCAGRTISQHGPIELAIRVYGQDTMGRCQGVRSGCGRLCPACICYRHVISMGERQSIEASDETSVSRS